MTDTAEFVDGLTIDQFKALIADLNPKRVAKRSQGGSQLSYLEAWDVRASLIRVFGFGGWDAEVIEDTMMLMEQDVKKANGGTTAFRVTVKVKVRLYIHATSSSYAEVAASTQAGAVFGDVLDFALKTAASDALKRCAMNLGTQFGLSLYNKGDTHDIVRLVLEPRQKAFLEELQAGKVAPKDPTPEDSLAGIGEVEPLPDDSEQPERDWAAQAAKLQNSMEVVELWREAKSTLPADHPVIAMLAGVARNLKDKEVAAAEAAAQPSIAAHEEAQGKLAEGFGGAAK